MLSTRRAEGEENMVFFPFAYELVIERQFMDQVRQKLDLGIHLNLFSLLQQGKIYSQFGQFLRVSVILKLILIAPLRHDFFVFLRLHR